MSAETIKRLRELEAGLCPGPFRSVQMEGHGSHRFIVSDGSNMVLAYCCSFGNIYGDQFVAEILNNASALLDAAERAAKLEAVLRIAEAALADIGDATRGPGDDLAWCERRAASVLPAVRAVLPPKEKP